ncbi:TRNA-specific adenosine deaminase [Phytophthora cinnamomi]|uniref:TRNA-specific adenosine deaminase n=1 Tax=Phytophthora cinnamomi TaxID=4785 RepID=UPI003559A451|nr:TRNA-specific adenosine deaminase [Phytophthora cinnamomi]
MQQGYSLLIAMVDVDDHEHFMREALLEGERALDRAEVPVGCVFVYKGEIIARASNRVNELFNATMHAEIVAIESIAATYGDKATEVLAESTLSVLNLHERSALPNSKVHRGFPCVSGILKEEAITLLKKFYTSENPRVEDSKKKRKKRGTESEEAKLPTTVEKA